MAQSFSWNSRRLTTWYGQVREHGTNGLQNLVADLGGVGLAAGKNSATTLATKYCYQHAKCPFCEEIFNMFPTCLKDDL